MLSNYLETPNGKLYFCNQIFIRLKQDFSDQSEKLYSIQVLTITSHPIIQIVGIFNVTCKYLVPCVHSFLHVSYQYKVYGQAAKLYANVTVQNSLEDAA